MHHSDFTLILVEQGFSPPTYDFQSTALGFHHEIYNTLIHENPIFNDRSRIYHQLQNSDAMLRCDLVTRTGDPVAAIPYLYRQWVTYLRYERPVREILIFRQHGRKAEIHVLLVSQHNAMTFLFEIT